MVTIKDIAKACGVSVSTVSYALSGKKTSISKDTVERIKAKADEMSYSPNLHARTLQKGRTDAIGIFVSGFDGVIHNLILAGLADVFRRSDAPYEMIVTFLDEDMHVLRNNTVDIGIIMDSRADIEKVETCAASLPIISFDLKAIQYPNIHNALIENKECVSMMCALMYQRGAKKLAFLSGSSASAHNHERLEGYMHGLKGDPLVYSADSFTKEMGYKTMSEAIEKDQELPFDGLVCSNDNLALGAMKALSEKGFEACRDYLVSGFDNIFESQIGFPTLTTISIDWFGLGVSMANLAMDILSDKDVKDIVCSGKVIERASTSFSDPR